MVPLGKNRLGQLQGDVLVLNRANRRGERCVARQEDRLGVADAEGSTASEPGCKVGRDVGEREFRVVVDLGDEQRRVEFGRRVGLIRARNKGRRLEGRENPTA